MFICCANSPRVRPSAPFTITILMNLSEERRTAKAEVSLACDGERRNGREATQGLMHRNPAARQASQAGEQHDRQNRKPQEKPSCCERAVGGEEPLL